MARTADCFELSQLFVDNGMSSFSTARLPATEEKVRSARVISDRPQYSPDVSDEVLLAEISSGDRELLAQLFRRYAPTIFAIGRRILRDTAEAEDLVQEVFLYLYKKCSLYDPSKGPARSWLIQVAYTQAFLRRRKLKSHGFYELPSTEKVVENQTSGAAYDYSVEGLFGRAGWKAVLDDLSDDQQQILRLHFSEGYTFAEIADQLGASYANVRTRYYRTLEKIRKHVSSMEADRQLTPFQL